MRNWFLHARESFWFLPSLFGLGAILLALGLTEVDRVLLDHEVVSIPLVTDLSATGGRAILVVIGGTMLGVAATSFSITISVLATSSSTYGPRLVRNFMADRGNQLVLAVLTSTFLYALVVLRAVRTEQDSTSAFVPMIAVTFAVIVAICDVAALVYFIHHIARSVQVTTLQGRVLAELLAVIDLLYPEHPKPASTRVRVADLVIQEAFTAPRSGYVQYVDIDDLVAWAESNDTVLRVIATPGTYVLEGQPIAHSLGAMPPQTEHTSGVRPDDEKAPSRSKAVAAAITIDAPRTPHQDLRFAAQDLVEIGVRGLASGANDPYTAVAAIDALSSAVVTLCTRPTPDGQFPGADGELRVLCAWPSAAEVIGEALLAMRTYGMQHPLVVRAGTTFIARIEAVANGDDQRALAEQADALRAAYLLTNPPRIDAEPTLAALDEVRARLSFGPPTAAHD
jgi:uncharacterized membrane protein